LKDIFFQQFKIFSIEICHLIFGYMSWCIKIPHECNIKEERVKNENVRKKKLAIWIAIWCSQRVFDSGDISRTVEENEEKEEAIAVVVMMVVATDRRSTIDSRQYQTYSIVNEQSFESNMRCPARMLGIHIQAVKVQRTVACRYARRVNRDKLSNWHRPSGTLPLYLRESANS